MKSPNKLVIALLIGALTVNAAYSADIESAAQAGAGMLTKGASRLASYMQEAKQSRPVRAMANNPKTTAAVAGAVLAIPALGYAYNYWKNKAKQAEASKADGKQEAEVNANESNAQGAVEQKTYWQRAQDRSAQAYNATTSFVGNHKKAIAVTGATVGVVGAGLGAFAYRNGRLPRTTDVTDHMTRENLQWAKDKACENFGWVKSKAGDLISSVYSNVPAQTKKVIAAEAAAGTIALAGSAYGLKKAFAKESLPKEVQALTKDMAIDALKVSSATAEEYAAELEHKILPKLENFESDAQLEAHIRLIIDTRRLCVLVVDYFDNDQEATREEACMAVAHVNYVLEQALTSLHYLYAASNGTLVEQKSMWQLAKDAPVRAYAAMKNFVASHPKTIAAITAGATGALVAHRQGWLPRVADIASYMPSKQTLNTLKTKAKDVAAQAWSMVPAQTAKAITAEVAVPATLGASVYGLKRYNQAQERRFALSNPESDFVVTNDAERLKAEHRAKLSAQRAGAELPQVSSSIVAQHADDEGYIIVDDVAPQPAAQWSEQELNQAIEFSEQIARAFEQEQARREQELADEVLAQRLDQEEKDAIVAQRLAQEEKREAQAAIDRQIADDEIYARQVAADQQAAVQVEAVQLRALKDEFANLRQQVVQLVGQINQVANALSADMKNQIRAFADQYRADHLVLMGEMSNCNNVQEAKELVEREKVVVDGFAAALIACQ